MDMNAKIPRPGGLVSDEVKAAARDCDIVGVYNHEVDANIGIHPPEQGVTQRVRISVSVGVTPRAEVFSEEIASVISYDFLVGAIREVVANGHFRLAETMAERLAEKCLAEPRAVFVRAKVEKIERLESGSLAVEITRYR